MKKLYFFISDAIGLSIAISFLAVLGLGAAGGLDQSFNPSAYVQPRGNVSVVVRQADGKILIGGNGFGIVNGQLRGPLVRLKADYSLDTSFANLDALEILAIGFQSNGKILVSGKFTVGVSTFSRIIRLHQDGTIDTSFALPLAPNTSINSDINAIYTLPNDKILIGGSFIYAPASGGAQRRSLARLEANGLTDESFVNTGLFYGISDLEVQSDGKILGGTLFTGPNSFLRRFNQDGSEDGNFNVLVAGSIAEFKIQLDAKILIGGTFTNVNNFPRRNLARLNSDGTLDESFTADTFSPISDIEIDVNSKIVVNGDFGTPDLGRNRVARLNSDGSIDPTFNFVPLSTSPLTIRDIQPLPDGRLVVGGDGFLSSYNGGQAYLLDQNGSINPAVNIFLGTKGSIWETAIQTDGKILLGGEFSAVNATVRRNLVRLNSSGEIDFGFNPEIGVSGTIPLIGAIAVQADGKMIIGGQVPSILVRLNANGTRDSSFSPNIATNGYISDIKILADGKILVSGTFKFGNEGNPRYLSKFNPDGSLDTSFQGTLLNDAVLKVVVQPDGKLLICGTFTSVGAITRTRFARLNSDGSADTSFNPLGGANQTVYDIGLQSDGKVVIGGLFTNVNGTSKFALARLNSNGTLDTGFSAALDATLSAVKILPNDQIYIGGSFLNVNGAPSRGLARLRPDGTTDAEFNVGTGTDGVVFAFEPVANNKLLIGGSFTNYNGTTRLSIARLLDNSRKQFDFDGDGKSDISVLRPSTNRWYELLSSNSQVVETTFGIANDVAAPADYDGDGKTDIGIFRPSNGNWWYLGSINNAQVNVQFGASGDIPRPSDFDGDGKDDFIVFRPSNSVWYRAGSTGVVSVAAFGATGDKPVIGDFDGDGKSDLAIYRPTTGVWWYQSSYDNSQRATGFGISTDVPVPADYDGDGKTDFAVYRPSTGVWYILNSGNGQATIVGFGLSEDKPVAADYDGDGKADIAVFRPSSGVWYLLRSTAGFGALTFGVSTDIPVPNAFVP